MREENRREEERREGWEKIEAQKKRIKCKMNKKIEKRWKEEKQKKDNN